MKRNEIDFTTGEGRSLFGKIIKFAVPVIMAYLVQQLYSSADLIFISNYIGKEGAAAVGASTSFIALSIGFFGGLTAGAGIIYARAYGARDIMAQKKISRVVFILSLTVGSVLSVIGFFTARPALMLLSTPEEILDIASVYASVYFLSIMPMMLYGMASGILRAAGDSRTPLIFQIIAGGLNILLDWWFISTWDNPIAGAAVASVIAQVVAGVCTHLYLKQVEKNLVVTEKDVVKTGLVIPRETGEIVKTVFSLGVPLGLQSMMMTFSNVVVQANVNSLGIDIMSAFATESRVEMAHWMAAASFGQTTLYALSQNLGAGKKDRISRLIRNILKVSVPTAIAIGLVTFFGGRFLFGLFTGDAEVIRLGVLILWFTCPFYAVYDFMEVMSNAIRSYGKTKVAMAIYLVFIAGLRIAGMIVFNLTGTLNIYTVSVVYPISWIAAALCAYLYWRKLKKREEIISAAG